MAWRAYSFGMLPLTQISRRGALKAIAALPLAPIATRADESPYLTQNLQNGRAWLAWSDAERVLFVFGVAAGIVAFSGVLDAFEDDDHSKAHKEALDAIYAPNVTIGDIQRQISRFYDDPANAPVPIGVLYPLAIYVFKGVAAERVQAVLYELRARFSTVSALAPR